LPLTLLTGVKHPYISTLGVKIIYTLPFHLQALLITKNLPGMA